MNTDSTFTSKDDVDATMLVSTTEAWDVAGVLVRLIDGVEPGDTAACIPRSIAGVPCELALELVRLRRVGDCGTSAPSCAPSAADEVVDNAERAAFKETLDTLRDRFRASSSESSTVTPCVLLGVRRERLEVRVSRAGYGVRFLT
jgi:hypothetical protein